MKFSNSTDYDHDLAHRRAYWVNRLVLFFNRIEAEDRDWDVEKGFVGGMDDGEATAMEKELGEIAENLKAEGLDFDSVLSGIEEGEITYDPHATDPPCIDMDRMDDSAPVVDYDEGTVTISEAEWDNNVDWPGYEW